MAKAFLKGVFAAAQWEMPFVSPGPFKGDEVIENTSTTPDKIKNEVTTMPLVYRKLKTSKIVGHSCFRLLELLPGTRQDDIACNLRDYDIEDAPSYEALSYCWGSAADPTPIQVNGKTLMVTPNLRAALLDIRLIDTPRIVWADAVCINQGSTSEKQLQVPMMGKIYRSADRTVVWLGIPEEENRTAMPILKTLLKNADNPEATVASMGINVIEGSVEKMFDVSWWGRAWVVQELALAKQATFVHGVYTMDWADLTTAVHVGFRIKLWAEESFGFMREDVWDNFQSMIDVKNCLELDSPVDKAINLLTDLRVRDATIIADKVYAILGIMDSVDLGIVPDYDTPLTEIYLRVAKWILKHSDHLGILSMAILNNDANGVDPRDLPSWAPDWSVWRPVASRFLSIKDRDRHDMKATGSSTFDPRFAGEERLLVLSGHHFDTITAVSPCMSLYEGAELDSKNPNYDPTDPDFTDDILPALKDLWWDVKHFCTFLSNCVPYTVRFTQWEEFAGLTADTRSPTGQTRKSVYWRTLCANAPGLVESDFDLWFKSMAYVRTMVDWKIESRFERFYRLSGFISYVRQNWQDYPKFRNHMGHVQHRRLAFTSRGYLCLIPNHADLGDEVYLCKGGQLPLVLRKTLSKNEYTLIGEGFVQEIMDGSGFKEDLCQDVYLA